MADVFDRLKSALADRYAIERELGSGGMATVYLAEDLKHERQVAAKVLRPELAAVLGAELQTDQAEAGKRIAQAVAEQRRAMAVAEEQEMKAMTQEMRARVVEAEAQVPLALAAAFRVGRLIAGTVSDGPTESDL